jgi:hypothetical protein
MNRAPLVFILAILAFTLTLSPVFAATNNNGFTLTNDGNNFNSGFNVSIDVPNVCIANVTRATGETALNAYVIVYNATYPAGVVGAAAAFGGSDTAVFSECYTVAENQVVGIAAGDITDTGNTAHKYDNTGITYPVVNTDLTWLAGIQNNTGGWEAMTGIAFAIESIGIAAAEVVTPICGNNVTEPPEECDGSAPEGYTCSESCALVPVVVPPTPSGDDAAALNSVIAVLAIALLVGLLYGFVPTEHKAMVLKWMVPLLGIVVVVILIALL